MSNRIYKLFAVGALPLALHGCTGCGDEEPAVNSNSTNTTKPPVAETNSSTPATPPATVKPAVSLDDLIAKEFSAENQDDLLETYKSLTNKKSTFSYQNGVAKQNLFSKNGDDESILTIFPMLAFSKDSYPAPDAAELFDEDVFNSFFEDKKSRAEVSDIDCSLRQDILERNMVTVMEPSLKVISTDVIVSIYDGYLQIGGETEQDFAKDLAKNGIKQNGEKTVNVDDGKVPSLMILNQGYRPVKGGSKRQWIGVAAMDEPNQESAMKAVRAVVKAAITMKLDFDTASYEETKEYQKFQEANAEKANKMKFNRWRQFDHKEGLVDGVGADAPAKATMEEQKPDSFVHDKYKKFRDSCLGLMKEFDQVCFDQDDGLGQKKTMWYHYVAIKEQKTTGYSLEEVIDMVLNLEKNKEAFLKAQMVPLTPPAAPVLSLSAASDAAPAASPDVRTTAELQSIINDTERLLKYNFSSLTTEEKVEVLIKLYEEVAERYITVFDEEGEKKDEPIYFGSRHRTKNNCLSKVKTNWKNLLREASCDEKVLATTNDDKMMAMIVEGRVPEDIAAWNKYQEDLKKSQQMILNLPSATQGGAKSFSVMVLNQWSTDDGMNGAFILGVTDAYRLAMAKKATFVYQLGVKHSHDDWKKDKIPKCKDFVQTVNVETPLIVDGVESKLPKMIFQSFKDNALKKGADLLIAKLEALQEARKPKAARVGGGF